MEEDEDFLKRHPHLSMLHTGIFFLHIHLLRFASSGHTHGVAELSASNSLSFFSRFGFFSALTNSYNLLQLIKASFGIDFPNGGAQSSAVPPSYNLK